VAGRSPITDIQGDTTDVAVKIRLKRMGKIRQPYYRVVVVDSRKKRDGKVIEQIGKYHPKEEPSFIEVASERAQYWLGVGAQPSEAVEAIFKVTGDWQKFKGLPGAEGTLKTAEPKRDKTEIFNEALKDAANEPKSEAVTKKKVAKKAETEDKPAIEPKAEKADKPEKAEEPKSEEPAAEKTEAAADEPAEASASTDEA
jgi:small subunit ribosomal protein S16